MKPNFHHDETQSSVQDVNTYLKNQVWYTRIVFGLFQLLELNYFVDFVFIRLVFPLVGTSLGKYDKHSLSLRCYYIKSIAYAVVKVSEITSADIGNM